MLSTEFFIIYLSYVNHLLMFSWVVKELCVLSRLSPSELVEEWIAHATGVGCDHEPTLLTLVEFEQKVGCNQEKSKSSSKVEFA